MNSRKKLLIALAATLFVVSTVEVLKKTELRNLRNEEKSVGTIKSDGPTSSQQNTQLTTKTDHTNSDLDVLQETPSAASATPAANCFSFEYRHLGEDQNKEMDDYLDYQNAFPILHNQYNPASLCVKVDQKAVPYKISTYQGKKEIVLGPVVQSESLIKISYCTGKAKCKEPCALPTHRFLDEVNEASLDANAFKENWGGKPTEDLEANVKAFRSVASQNIFRQWNVENQSESNCKKE